MCECVRGAEWIYLFKDSYARVCDPAQRFLWYLRLNGIYCWHPNKINIEMAIWGGNKNQQQK